MDRAREKAWVYWSTRPCRGQRGEGDLRRGTKDKGDQVDRAREKAWVY